MSGAVSALYGVGRKAAFEELSIPVAGKTGVGSSWDVNDLNFIGYTPYYAAGIWSGYDELTPEQAQTMEVNSGIRTLLFTNQTYILDIWRDVMEEIHKELNLPDKSFPFTTTEP